MCPEEGGSSPSSVLQHHELTASIIVYLFNGCAVPVRCLVCYGRGQLRMLYFSMVEHRGVCPNGDGSSPSSTLQHLM